jgi:hypothetical protein
MTIATKPNYRRQFQLALIETTVEDVARADAPCAVCGRPHAKNVGVWAVPREIAERLGMPSGTTRLCFYAVCTRCARQVDGDSRIRQYLEEAILALHSGGSKHAGF